MSDVFFQSHARLIVAEYRSKKSSDVRVYVDVFAIPMGQDVSCVMIRQDFLSMTRKHGCTTCGACQAADRGWLPTDAWPSQQGVATTYCYIFFTTDSFCITLCLACVVIARDLMDRLITRSSSTRCLVAVSLSCLSGGVDGAPVMARDSCTAVLHGGADRGRLVVRVHRRDLGFCAQQLRPEGQGAEEVRCGLGLPCCCCCCCFCCCCCC